MTWWLERVLANIGYFFLLLFITMVLVLLGIKKFGMQIEEEEALQRAFAPELFEKGNER